MNRPLAPPHQTNSGIDAATQDAVTAKDPGPVLTAALEPDTVPNHPLRAQDVPGFIPKLID